MTNPPRQKEEKLFTKKTLGFSLLQGFGIRRRSPGLYQRNNLGDE